MWTLRRTGARATATAILVTGGVLVDPRTFGQDVNGDLFVATSSTVLRIDAG